MADFFKYITFLTGGFLSVILICGFKYAWMKMNESSKFCIYQHSLIKWYQNFWRVYGYWIRGFNIHLPSKITELGHLGIVPFVLTPLKGRFVAPRGLEIGKMLLWKYEVSTLKGRCHEWDYTRKLIYLGQQGFLYNIKNSLKIASKGFYK